MFFWRVIFGGALILVSGMNNQHSKVEATNSGHYFKKNVYLSQRY